MVMDGVAPPSVVAGQCTFLVLAAPLRPAEPVGDAVGGVGDQFGEGVPYFVDGQGDHGSCTLWTVGAFVRGDDGEDGVCEHGQGGVAVPGGPGPDLVLVEAGLTLSGLETFLDAPTDPGDAYEGGQAD